MSTKAQTFDALQYIKLLFSKGWRQYYLSDLPGYLQNEKMHKSAIQLNIVSATGNRRGLLKEYAIPPDIMSQSHFWIRRK